MKTPLTPLDIEVLLWSHAHCQPFPQSQAPAVRQAQSMFLDCGMIKVTSPEAVGLRYCMPPIYQTTPKGGVMVNKLCHTPEPKCVWQ